ncbi:MAG: hypothetical protein AAFR03_04655 [Pseudomonadota bacterium]
MPESISTDAKLSLARTQWMPKMALLAAPLLLISPVSAQGPANDIIAICERSDDAAQRIACLENALRNLSGENGPTTAGSTTKTAPSDATVIENQPATLETSAAAGPETPGESVAGNAVTGLGAEQVLRKRVVNGEIEDKAPRQETHAVAEHGRSASGLLLMILENGQVWRQKRSDGVSVRLSKNRPYTVTISDGAVSGYKMKIHQASKTIRVERLN